jgi:hypothetical protein
VVSAADPPRSFSRPEPLLFFSFMNVSNIIHRVPQAGVILVQTYHLKVPVYLKYLELTYCLEYFQHIAHLTGKNVLK